MQRRYLVTGGAGYVGSHVVAALIDRGDAVVVIDNLPPGAPAAVPAARGWSRPIWPTRRRSTRCWREGRWDGVLHFASLSLVGESMRTPFRYLIENAMTGIRLIDACVRHGVARFVLSSTANLFGASTGAPIAEDAAIDPGSPYGESKWMIERALLLGRPAARAAQRPAALLQRRRRRPGRAAGEDHRPETHLIPLVIDAALGRRPPLEVFGDDYPTPDGTCIRDYVHVTDLADAHLRALDQIDARSVTYNLGNGLGHSVLQVIEAVERIGGRRVPTPVTARRPGDPAMLVAASDLIRRETGWTPLHADLDHIVRTAWAWREAHPDGYGG